MVYGYMRTSTGGQDGTGQVNKINAYAAENGLKIDSWVKEQISSRKPRSEREISRLVEMLGPGDTVLVSELSRLGRSSMTEISAIVESIRDAGAELVVVSDRLTISPGHMPVQVSALLNALGIAAQIEREMVSQRTKAALQARREQGVKLGRPKGTSKLRDRDDEIQRYLDLGLNKASISKLLGVSRSTLYDYLRETERAGKEGTYAGKGRNRTGA